MIQTTLKPEEIQYWDEFNGGLTQTQRNKSKKFVEFGCLEYLGDNRFACNPIEGYNSTTHIIEKDPDFKFRCSCQGFRMKEKRFRQFGGEVPFCSHILALLFCFRQKKFDRWWLRVKEDDVG